MGYTTAANQEGVPEGHTRFRFDTTIGGVRHRKVITCHPDEVKTLYNRWVEGIRTAPPREYTGVAMVDSYLMRYQGKPDYIQRVRRVLNEFMKTTGGGDIHINDLKRHDVEVYIAWLRQDALKPSTVNRRLAIISRFYQWTIDNEYRTRPNPVRGTSLKEDNMREIYLLPPQLRTLIMTLTDESFEDTWTEVRIAGMLATFGGLRLGEILSLTPMDIDLDIRLIVLTGDHTKSDRGRFIPFPTILQNFLRRHITDTTSDEPLFPGRTSYHMSYKWKRFQAFLGFTTAYGALRFHDLRHVYAQLCRQLGMPMGNLADILGHCTPAFTQKRYAQTMPENVRREIDKMDEIVQMWTTEESDPPH